MKVRENRKYREERDSHKGIFTRPGKTEEELTKEAETYEKKGRVERSYNSPYTTDHYTRAAENWMQLSEPLKAAEDYRHFRNRRDGVVYPQEEQSGFLRYQGCVRRIRDRLEVLKEQNDTRKKYLEGVSELGRDLELFKKQVRDLKVERIADEVLW